ncbi:MAG: hypothetical protein IJM18_00130 [Clostridia bacterium]|nr:hypothetical protein [Clostridia bacterium]
MKRRHYRIHYTDHSQPMHRVKRKHVSWGGIALVVLALALIAAGVFAVIKWIELGGSEASLPVGGRDILSIL